MGMSQARSKKNSKSKRRTPRACERCRLKRAKCDGTTPCNTCQASDSTCMYTARRRRDARSYYCQMREVTDEALQRLYRACRSNSGFPGDILDESQCPPSTTAILHALGLTAPSLKGTGRSEDIQRPDKVLPLNYSDHSENSRHLDQAVIPPAGESSMQDEYLPSPATSPATSSFSMASLAQSPKTSPCLTTMILRRPATPPEMDMSEQFIYALSEGPSSSRSSSMNTGQYSYTSHSSNPVFDMESYLDTSSCSIPTSAYPTDNLYASMQFDISTTTETGSHQTRDVSIACSQPPTTCDRFLLPWPGSLAAAYTAAH